MYVVLLLLCVEAVHSVNITYEQAGEGVISTDKVSASFFIGPWCQAGWYADPQTGVCTLCAAGTYQPAYVNYWAPYQFDGLCRGSWVYATKRYGGQAVYTRPDGRYLYWMGNFWMDGTTLGVNWGNCILYGGYEDAGGPTAPRALYNPSSVWQNSGPITNVFNCPPCPVGSHCPSQGMSDFTLCPIGSYCPSSAMSVATPCASGTYTTTLGSTSCTPCDSCAAGTQTILKSVVFDVHECAAAGLCGHGSSE